MRGVLMIYFFNSFCSGLGKTKILFISLMLVFSCCVGFGLYSGFSQTAAITKLASEPETTSSVSTTITTSSTIRDTTIESMTTTTSSTSTTSTIPPGDPECEELSCPSGTNFVGSKNSDMYHYCSCSHAKRINPENLLCFSTEEEAIEEGYTQSSCQPSTTTSSISTTTSSTSSTGSTITTTTSTTSTTTSSTTTTISLPELSLDVIVEKDPIVRGNDQTIITEVIHEDNFIENAQVNVDVTYASGYVKNCGNGLTNSSGLFVCKWKIGGSSKTGTFNVNVTATKENYNLAIKHTSFEVISAS